MSKSDDGQRLALAHTVINVSTKSIKARRPIGRSVPFAATRRVLTHGGHSRALPFDLRDNKQDCAAASYNKIQLCFAPLRASVRSLRGFLLGFFTTEITLTPRVAPNAGKRALPAHGQALTPRRASNQQKNIVKMSNPLLKIVSKNCKIFQKGFWHIWVILNGGDFL